MSLRVCESHENYYRRSIVAIQRDSIKLLAKANDQSARQLITLSKYLSWKQEYGGAVCLCDRSPGEHPGERMTERKAIPRLLAQLKE